MHSSWNVKMQEEKKNIVYVSLLHRPPHCFATLTTEHLFTFIYSLKPALESQWPPVCFSVWLHLLLASDSAERLGESTIAVSESSWLRCKVCVWPLQDDLEQK